MNAKAPEYGNLQVVAMLERYLMEARKGKINLACIACCIPPNVISTEFAGTLIMKDHAFEAIEKLKSDLGSEITNITLPDRDPALGADYACYNAAAGPMSYDFLTWLVDREMHRVRMGVPAPLKVGFFYGRDGKAAFNIETRRQMFYGVARPSLELLGAVEDREALNAATKEFYLITDIVKAARAGEAVPRYKATLAAKLQVGQWLGGGPYVTITLRETAIWEHRNSNLAAWFKFGRWLKKQGMRVVFVRDTRMVKEPLPPDLTVYPPASIDLHARCALYEMAEANLFVANGPVHLALFGTRPFVSFTQLYPEGHSDYVNTAQFWETKLGVKPGEPFPWLRPDQFVEWCLPGEGFDTFDRIKAAWEKLNSALIGQPARTEGQPHELRVAS